MQGILTRDSGIPGEKCDLLTSFMKESKREKNNFQEVPLGNMTGYHLSC